MNHINRRLFLRRSSLAAGAAIAFSQVPKSLAGEGYKLVEMCSPKGYVNSGFGSLVDMKPSDMRKIIHDAGLDCPSCHFGLKELTNDLDDRIEFAKGLGLKAMI